MEQKFKITLTLDVQDVTRIEGGDRGNSAVLVNNEISEEGRHAMQKDLMSLLAKWGDDYLAVKAVSEDTPAGPPLKRPGR